MSPCLRRARHGQAAVKNWALRPASAGLAIAAVVGFGLLTKTRAAENLHAVTPPVASILNITSQTIPALNPEQSGLVTLRGNTRPEATPGNDLGRVADDFPLDHLMLQLRRNPQREHALEQFIQELHDPASPHFHHWLTAAEFGKTFGPSAEQVAQVSAWLGSMGFQVHLVYPSQMLIDFSGSAGQVGQAFHTEIHSLRVNGRRHFANIRDPQIPAALAASIAGIVSLSDFPPQRMLAPHSNYTAGGDSYPVVPADLWTIYNFNPIFAAGYSGQGQAMVVIEDTDLYSAQDWTNFRNVLGLSAGYPAGALSEIHPASYPANNCTDPGVNADDLEAAVDAEWASAGAPNATIELASCSNIAVWGGFVALQNLLNQSGAPPAVVSISYGESESLLGAAYNAYINSLYQQAAAEGVSVFVSSGDEGAAASDYDAPFAQGGINVSGLTSTPYNVSVGGTDFADTYQRTNSTYWNSSNAANYGSALSYIPEIPWNDSCASVLRADFMGLLPTYGANSLCDKINPNTLAAGGGPSGCATGAPDAYGIGGGTCAGYAKPWWQTPLTGNPADGVRDIPDLALFASNNSWGHAYVVCYSDPSYGGTDCSGAPATWFSAGGTSFAAPIMAAIQSLINQASGSRWGNPDPAYYSLAATQFEASGAACNSALGRSVGANCIFHDVNPIPLLYTGTGTGGDIDVPCVGVNCRLPAGSYGALSTAPQSLNMVEVTSPGSGYTSAPACSLSGGGGTGAACAAKLTGQVDALALTNPGSGYIPAGTTCTLAGGGGTGAACVASIYGTGQIAGVILANPGSGYTSAPACTISGGGTGATCAATEQLGLLVSLTAGGSGYTTMPHCVLSGGDGTGATCAALAINSSSAYSPAFTAAPQWDFATGLGSVNVANLAAAFLSSSAMVSPMSLAFQPQIPGTTSASQSITVTNTGTVAFTLLAVTVGGANSGDFAKSSDTCTGAALSPRSSCTVSVSFTPTAVGNRTASLNFSGLAPQGSQSVALSGVGIGAGAVLSPDSVSFADQIVGESATQTINLTNPGNVPLTLGGMAISGSNDFGETNTCGAILAAGSTCSITVTFAPSAPGSATAAITVTGIGLNEPQTVALVGTGAIPVPFVNPTLTPASAAPGGEAFTLRVTGTGFARGAAVDWNGTALATTYLSSEEVAAAVPAHAIAAPGTARVGVANPGAEGNSNLVPFSVSPPAPTAVFALATGSPIAVGTFPLPMVAGDFNGDGKDDIAILNETSQSVTLLLGQGDGTFVPAAGSPATGMNPSAIAAGDFNGDGKLDLAITNLGTGNLTILLGNGDGTFRAAASPATAAQPVAIATGDFNGDGKLDLAVVNQGSYNVTILLGNGDGTFSATSASPGTGAMPEGIAAGDFNGDGKLDLAVTNSGDSSVSILLGHGDGTFASAAAPATGPSPYAIATADFNDDGKLDLAVANQGNCGVTLLLGNGDGTFTPAAPSAVPPGISNYSIAVADFNADGKPDLAVANNGSGQATILLGNGDGTFAPTGSPPVTGADPWGVAVGDFNGDGRMDFVTANSESNSVSVMLQSPQGPAAAVSPGSLTFSSQSAGTASAAQAITLSNPGTAALTVAAITASGNFSQTNNCQRSVPAGGSCTILVTFTPSATGALSGTLTITDNTDGLTGSTQTMTLAGTGTAPLTASPAPVADPSSPAGVLPLQSGH